MKVRNEGIMLAGDSVTDICLLKLPARGGAKGSDRGFAIWTEGGGVELTERTLKALGFGIRRTLEDASPKTTRLHSLVTLAPIKIDRGTEVFDPKPKPDKPAEARVVSFDGYFRDATTFITPVREMEDDTDAPIRAIFLNDANGGVRDSKEVVTKIIEAKGVARFIIHKMHPPLRAGSRIRKALMDLSDLERLLIVSAMDLRLEGVRLRGHLSWDAVLEDLAEALKTSDNLLANLCEEYGKLLIQFDVEAVALLTSNEEGIKITFVFDPTSAEGDLAEERPGSLYGQMNAFACALAAALSEEDWVLGIESLKTALAAARVYAAGAIRVPLNDTTHPLLWPGIGIHREAAASTKMRTADKPKTDAERRYSEFEALRNIELTPSAIANDPDFRLILRLESGDLYELCSSIVKMGEDKVKTLPSARIGKFVTIDRTEMEGYRTIQRLIDRYLADESVTKPISIGVFGPPGAGKSFGIKQIVEKRNIPFREFNMSEAAEEALPGYFHELRDIRLRGKVPLCFFDEFDSRGRSIVARFLAPMQDGEFRDGTRTHPVGRAILVFAGGTAWTAEHFQKAARYKTDGTVNKPNDDQYQKAKDLKIPDFVSRLSTTLDVLGPNPVGQGDEEGHVLRRAVLLRNLIEKTLPQVATDGDGHADIDESVIRAFLSGGDFTFGARSIEQVLKMCAVPLSQARLGISDLPDESRLKLHLKTPTRFFQKVHNEA
ncbi:AAA family ATPase [Roseibium marinum]|uniref:ATPase family protein associated with various cellular activities (AAA) n=1 Tax=Roseibium marinum TaxID=281252 RepID=A0A2S3URA7_9HYPH|nr:AAA family ATPase [Roseibium marinum]POF30248.1 ATPase family protein associated with various cellular activities (AAA) [Roseibium marinum]